MPLSGAPTFLRALILLGGVCGGFATAAPATAPKSPARPIESRGAPAPKADAPAGGRQPVDVDVQSLQPYNLPPASRAKMRACGEEWRAMKLAGQATGLTWRTFAEKCLVK